MEKKYTENISNGYDKTYKSFLENKETFFEFLQDFVKADWKIAGLQKPLLENIKTDMNILKIL